MSEMPKQDNAAETVLSKLSQNRPGVYRHWCESTVQGIAGLDTSECSSPKKRRKKVTYSPEQVEMLEKIFLVNNYPCKERLQTIATALSLDEERVRNWFQNRRAKLRRQFKKLEMSKSGLEQKMSQSVLKHKVINGAMVTTTTVALPCSSAVIHSGTNSCRTSSPMNVFFSSESRETFTSQFYTPRMSVTSQSCGINTSDRVEQSPTEKMGHQTAYIKPFNLLSDNFSNSLSNSSSLPRPNNPHLMNGPCTYRVQRGQSPNLSCRATLNSPNTNMHRYNTYNYPVRQTVPFYQSPWMQPYRPQSSEVYQTILQYYAASGYNLTTPHSQLPCTIPHPQLNSGLSTAQGAGSFTNENSFVLWSNWLMAYQQQILLQSNHINHQESYTKLQENPSCFSEESDKIYDSCDYLNWISNIYSSVPNTVSGRGENLSHEPTYMSKGYLGREENSLDDSTFMSRNYLERGENSSEEPTLMSRDYSGMGEKSPGEPTSMSKDYSEMGENSSDESTPMSRNYSLFNLENNKTWIDASGSKRQLDSEMFFRPIDIPKSLQSNGSIPVHVPKFCPGQLSVNIPRISSRGQISMENQKPCCNDDLPNNLTDANNNLLTTEDHLVSRRKNVELKLCMKKALEENSSVTNKYNQMLSEHGAPNCTENNVKGSFDLDKTVEKLLIPIHSSIQRLPSFQETSLFINKSKVQPKMYVPPILYSRESTLNELSPRQTTLPPCEYLHKKLSLAASRTSLDPEQESDSWQTKRWSPCCGDEKNFFFSKSDEQPSTACENLTPDGHKNVVSSKESHINGSYHHMSRQDVNEIWNRKMLLDDSSSDGDSSCGLYSTDIPLSSPSTDGALSPIFNPVSNSVVDDSSP